MEGVRFRPSTAPPRAGDVRDSQADTTAAVRDLGHAPRFSFEEGMRRTLEWYRHERKKETRYDGLQRTLETLSAGQRF
jgi:nucleoside-diphosphate-sugar epimerase